MFCRIAWELFGWAPGAWSMEANQIHLVFWDWNGRRWKIVLHCEEGCTVNCSDHMTRDSKSYSIFSLPSFVSSSSICNAADAEVTKEARAYVHRIWHHSSSGFDFWQSPFQELSLSSVTDISKSVLTCWKGKGWLEKIFTKIVSSFGPKEVGQTIARLTKNFFETLPNAKMLASNPSALPNSLTLKHTPPCFQLEAICPKAMWSMPSKRALFGWSTRVRRPLNLTRENHSLAVSKCRTTLSCPTAPRWAPKWTTFLKETWRDLIKRGNWSNVCVAKFVVLKTLSQKSRTPTGMLDERIFVVLQQSQDVPCQSRIVDLALTADATVSSWATVNWMETERLKLQVEILKLCG